MFVLCLRYHYLFIMNRECRNNSREMTFLKFHTKSQDLFKMKAVEIPASHTKDLLFQHTPACNTIQKQLSFNIHSLETDMLN